MRGSLTERYHWSTDAIGGHVKYASRQAQSLARSTPARVSEWRARRQRGLARRPLVWVYRNSIQGSGTFMRGEQLSAMVRKHARDRLVVRYTDETGVTDLRNSVIWATRSFLADATPEELERLRAANNIICADYLDFPPRPLLHPHIDVYIAASVSQLNWLRKTFPRKTVHHVTHHADPATARVRVPVDFCNIGYFGEIPNAKYRAELQGLVGFVQTNNANYRRRDWVYSLRHYNMHYAVRTWFYPTRDPGPGSFKPFTKGFNAAHCRANIIVPGTESDAEHYLGGDYPYMLADDSLKTVREMVEFAKDSFRGPEWFGGLEVMAELRRATAPARIAQEVEDLVRSCD